MLNVRLDEQTEAQLNSLSQKKGVSKSALVKEALDLFLKNEKAEISAYELGKDLFGVDGSEDPEGSQNFKAKIKQKLHGKYSH
ncbi:ribbon-helix-helix domain-containing protein [Aquiflexum sp. TKW24L]|uniref:ribbon-helix-helix domain-containing protein n=1 Tax=Aquiflexum sp. TKW24L TaxID=2942212 RepID=UPI0020C0881F|nr:CopG family transcriptional regulator [Aquiflexum sp. TKW24L]MCL6261035.1 ribbon-helix-helix domain-containing protein [Aquiflexum sp. TKW24L]